MPAQSMLMPSSRSQQMFMVGWIELFLTFPNCPRLIHQRLREVVVVQTRELINAFGPIVVLNALVKKGVPEAR